MVFCVVVFYCPNFSFSVFFKINGIWTEFQKGNPLGLFFVRLAFFHFFPHNIPCFLPISPLLSTGLQTSFRKDCFFFYLFLQAVFIHFFVTILNCTLTTSSKTINSTYKVKRFRSLIN